LVALVQPRTDQLFGRLAMSWSDRPTYWLDRVESGVPEGLWTDAYWEPSHGPETLVLRGRAIEHDQGPRLSALGEALGADLGLLLARSFSSALGEDARWVIAAHGRTHVSNGLPVLRGRGKAEFDPLLVGLNLARRYIPGYIANQHQLGLSALHDRWLADLADPAWGTSEGR
jgi:hypothetical protein